MAVPEAAVGAAAIVWLSVLLAAVVTITVPQVVGASPAAGDIASTRGADEPDLAKLTPFGPQLGLGADPKDLEPPEPHDSSLSSHLRSSFLYQILHSEAALRRRQKALHRENPDDEKNNDISDDDDDGDNKHADDKVNNDDDDDVDSDVVKRVFCNGFTGCGGRHRQVSRRRRILGKRLIPVLVKRRFCTSFGCFRTRSSSAEEFPLARFVTRSLSRGVTGDAKGREKGQAKEKEEDEDRKRLFCNHYGGCRGGGKRSLFSPWMSRMSSVADSRR